MSRIIWPLVIVCSGVVAVLLAGSSLQTLLRVLFTFWFLLVCPGMAFVRLFRFKEKLAEWVLAIALSIALDVIVSEIAVLNGWWSLQGMVDVLVGLSILGAAIQVWVLSYRRKQVSNEFDRR